MPVGIYKYAYDIYFNQEILDEIKAFKMTEEEQLLHDYLDKLLPCPERPFYVSVKKGKVKKTALGDYDDRGCITLYEKNILNNISSYYSFEQEFMDTLIHEYLHHLECVLKISCVGIRNHSEVFYCGVALLKNKAQLLFGTPFYKDDPKERIKSIYDRKFIEYLAPKLKIDFENQNVIKGNIEIPEDETIHKDDFKEKLLLVLKYLKINSFEEFKNNRELEKNYGKYFYQIDNAYFNKLVGIL